MERQDVAGPRSVDGGRVEVESQPETGATFMIVLPLHGRTPAG